VLAALAVLVFGGAMVVVNALRVADAPGAQTTLGILAVTASVLLARLLAATPLVHPLTFLGRNTLPIYVAHVILIAMAAAALAKVGVPAEWRIALPLCVAASVIAAALAAEKLASRSMLRYLYQAPPMLLPRSNSLAAPIPVAMPKEQGVHPARIG